MTTPEAIKNFRNQVDQYNKEHATIPNATKAFCDMVKQYNEERAPIQIPTGKDGDPTGTVTRAALRKMARGLKK